MGDYRLLRSQRNIAFNILARAGLDPCAFIWSDERREGSLFHIDGIVSVLTHEATGHFFEFDTRSSLSFLTFSPGRDAPEEGVTFKSWPLLWGVVEDWIGFLKREIEAPDLWAAALEASELADASMAEDKPFTDEEREEARRGIETVRKKLLERGDLQEHTAAINERLDRLEDAIAHSSRWAWFHTAIGVIFTIATACSLSPAVARELFQHLNAVFQGTLRLAK